MPEAFLVIKIVFREHLVHIWLLFDADAVFPREHPSGCERSFNDLCSSGVNTIVDSRFLAVEEQQRMQVSISGMENVHHGEVVLIGNSVDLFECVRKF